MRTAAWSASVSVLDRITAVFDAFGPLDEGLGMTELAQRANLPKSTVSRIAADLVEQRFLERQGDKLYLGVRLYELGQNVDEPRRLRRLALPIMAELRDLTDRTVTLALVQGAQVLHIAVVRSRSTGVSLGSVGARVPAPDSALGKAVRASGAPDGGAGLPRVVVVTDERASGLTHLATSVVSRGVPIAALSLCGPDGAIDVEALTPLLQRAASALGHRVTASRDR
jgi:IclR family acetate operon transcriptional repressor